MFIPKVGRYFGSRLHDSWVMSISYTGDSLTLCLNEFYSHVFCDALVELTNIKIPHERRQCPVSFTFENVRSCSLCRINKNDKVMPINKKKYLPKLTEYLWDEIHEISSQRIKMGIGFWADLPGRQRNNLILEIDAERLVIKEEQRDAVLTMFGEEYISLFDSYWQELESICAKQTQSQKPQDQPNISMYKDLRRIPPESPAKKQTQFKPNAHLPMRQSRPSPSANPDRSRRNRIRLPSPLQQQLRTGPLCL